MVMEKEYGRDMMRKFLPYEMDEYLSTLYRDRVHIARTRSTYTSTVTELPDQAGVDPFLLLVDRIPDDNTKKVAIGVPPKRL
jgi:hypothetical protein